MVSDTIDTYLSVIYPAGVARENETLSLQLTCTNRHLAENLKLGDICKPTSSSPERFTFRNITPVTASIDPPNGEKLLWDVIKPYHAESAVFVQYRYTARATALVQHDMYPRPFCTQCQRAPN